jgi:hypothetical protein
MRALGLLRSTLARRAKPPWGTRFGGPGESAAPQDRAKSPLCGSNGVPMSRWQLS